ncbi:PA0069 family radical SAM protein [Burkholderia multivorans]|uniref:PA0069 family radical SAM protein n=1 Tax=Burkholderia multivorans TaxID=87883 RepID=UPI0009E0D944|nr:PA0069 family radical SAM protein [Burkholderia multivorans]MBU9668807.1 PA0069 family radical SAM protein [Burkholderia multivorans]MCA8503799.1 PA0069 family radical SAM protein [Burkholderia multivorans]MDN8082499.1 PA0069 family radical SAM protein [Burkholderia multivorans]SAK28964.1 radical SAM domain-containing protein [Burkholderia multivorans]SAK33494.1 radical SAM domain-containing protein [Burkholderia multivorans]
MGAQMDDRSDNEFPIAPPVPRKGRGAVDNLQGRYESALREAVDDGWAHVSDDADLPALLRTQVFEERAKSILTRNQSPDIPFSVSLNPYRGCEHGCIYCFARPTHSYLGLSPGLDFESRIYAKINAAELLEREISRKSYVPEPIALGVNTDAYQPVERDLRITRSVIEVMHDRGLPFAAITKSSLIERDLDLLAPMAERGQVMAAVTITTLDADLARTLEPRAATPARRLRTIRALRDAGVPVGVSIAPLIPFVTEPDLERVLEACAEAGATHASYIILRLPWEVAPLFKSWLAAHFPDRADRVMNRVRDMRGGKDYDSDFAKRMKGEGIWADLLRQRFRQAVKRLGLNERRHGILDLSQFRAAPASVAAAPRATRRAPAQPVRDDVQMSLF